MWRKRRWNLNNRNDHGNHLRHHYEWHDEWKHHLGRNHRGCYDFRRNPLREHDLLRFGLRVTE
jgi:hypothetical protein